MRSKKHSHRSKISKGVHPKDWSRIPKVIGMGLFLTSVLVGVSAMVSPATTEQYWVFTKSLPAGMKLTSSDVKPISLVQSTDLKPYQVALDELIGQDLVRDVFEGELVSTQVTKIQLSTLQELTLSFPASSLPPKLEVGDQLDLWIVPKDAAGNALAGANLVTSSLLVSAVSAAENGFGADQSITFFTQPLQVPLILDAISLGSAYVVRR